VSRRVELPGASELFRPTTQEPPSVPLEEQPAEAGGLGSGRVRHEEKITVYVSSQELLALEQARLALRAEHGLAVDRGRIVRTAISLVVADLAERGAASDLVRGLGES
jgi:hypothetical protein